MWERSKIPLGRLISGLTTARTDGPSYVRRPVVGSTVRDCSIDLYKIGNKLLLGGLILVMSVAIER